MCVEIYPTTRREQACRMAAELLLASPFLVATKRAFQAAYPGESSDTLDMHPGEEDVV